MLLTRRSFLKTAAAAGSSLLIRPGALLSNSYNISDAFFDVHDFIEHHPDAVFIMRTYIDTKTNSAAIKQAGLDFGRSVFIRKGQSEGGIPITYKVVIKPNLTCRSTSDPNYSRTGTMGIVTDSYFVEGIIESIKETGVEANKFFIRESNCPSDFEEGGYFSMAGRTGADLKDLSANVNSLSPDDVQWTEVSNGIYFNKLPFIAPVNSPDSFLINIAKFKSHTMGMTLCAKNLQGTIAHNYVEHCRPYNRDMDITPSHIMADAKTAVMANYLRHLSQGIPRWDKPGDQGGLMMELWATRCIDNNSVTRPGIHIIEGIYGRDGHFIIGPGPNGLASDYMSNIIVFGKNPFHVDNIGTWLGGHEPGNFGLFHLAIERGFASILNPMEIPLYEWKHDSSATKVQLKEFTRTPLKTTYLQKDYNGQNEEKWHLVNEPYKYPTGISRPNPSQKPVTFALNQNYPNPFNPSTSIEFFIPKSGMVRLEILDVHGQLIDLLANGYYSTGSHLAVWNNKNRPSGVYFYRMFFEGYVQTKQMVLLK